MKTRLIMVILGVLMFSAGLAATVLYPIQSDRYNSLYIKLDTTCLAYHGVPVANDWILMDWPEQDQFTPQVALMHAACANARLKRIFEIAGWDDPISEVK